MTQPTLSREQVYHLAVRLRVLSACLEGARYIEQWLATDAALRAEVEAWKQAHDAKVNTAQTLRKEIRDLTAQLTASEARVKELTEEIERLRHARA